MTKMKYHLRFLLFFLFINWSFLVFAGKTDERPNVIVILTDDQGTLDLNCYGSDDLITPNMDKLVRSGVRFTQFYAAAAVCSPSRAALLTGKTNLRAGQPGNVPVPEYADGKRRHGMPTEQITIAEYLKKEGYYTALIGKWHLGHEQERLPNGQGFDYFFGHQRGCIDNYSHFFFWQGPNKHDLYRNSDEVYYPGTHFMDLMTVEVVDIVESPRPEPFFIFWAINAPHYPYQGTPQWLEKYGTADSPRKEYAAFISSMDEKVGLVLNALDKSGKRDNTIIIFQSDHGHSCEERAFWGGGNAGPYRGCKFSLFEGGIRVPAAISYPRVIPPDQVRAEAAISMDWLPTLADLLQLDIKERLDGRSLMPMINEKSMPSPDRILYWQFGDYDDRIAQWAVREGPWKLIGNPKDPSEGNNDFFEDKLFLANLETDESEKDNLASQHPDKVDQLKKLHDQWLVNIRKEMGQ